MKFKYLFALIAACACFACNSGSKTQLDQVVTSNETFFEKEEEKQKDPMAADTARLLTPPSPQQEEPKTQTNKFVDWDKKIIKSGSFAIEVKDYKKYRTQLAHLVKSHGAYVAGEQESQTDERLENRMTVKVPVSNFQNLVDDFSTIESKVLNKEIASQDVTTEVVDTKSRIEAKKKIRQRYLDFLAQAKSMDDILSIQSEINEVQEQLEMAEGRVKYLNHSSSYSTINLYYFQILNDVPKDNGPTFTGRMLTAFSTGWEIIKAVLVAVTTLWPLWIICAAILFHFKRRKVATVKV